MKGNCNYLHLHVFFFDDQDGRKLLGQEFSEKKGYLVKRSVLTICLMNIQHV